MKEETMLVFFSGFALGALSVAALIVSQILREVVEEHERLNRDRVPLTPTSP
jgi:hypothetical protein